jgi:hypothetical protein
MALRQTLSTGTSESSIIFFNGGHNHNGVSSALIDVSKYSLYDLTTDFLGTTARQEAQSFNYGKFKEVISRIVKEDVLTIAGIKLLPNEVKAENITAGAITADKLSANIVLINNVIRSNNFDGTVLANGAITTAGTTGWAVSGQGQAVFDTSFIRGSLTASSVSTPGIDIDSNGNLTANNFSLYANGFMYASGGNFQVDASGNLYAENVNITGEINATSGSVSGDLVSGGTISGVELSIGSNFEVDAFGNLSANNATLTGTINASSGTIGGYSIDATSLYSGTISLQSGLIQVNQGYESGYAKLGGGESRFNKVGFQNQTVSGWDTNFYPYADGGGSLGISGSFRWNNLNYLGTLNDQSDERTKTSITPLPSMLSLINSLNPVSYLKKVAQAESMTPLPDNGKRPGVRKHFGLIAQEVRSAMNANGFDVNEYSGWGMVDKDDPESEQMLMYLEFTGILIKGVQELSEKIQSLEARLTEIEG